MRRDINACLLAFCAQISLPTHTAQDPLPWELCPSLGLDHPTPINLRQSPIDTPTGQPDVGGPSSRLSG